MVNSEQFYSIARLLIRNGIVELRPDNPFHYSAGGIGPVYCDNRQMYAFPGDRRTIRDAFLNVIMEEELHPEIIAGTATAGIPWAAWVADVLYRPMVYVRGEAKGHGKGKKIEGGDVKGKRVLLIEDLINTGTSSIACLDAIREAGGIVDTCLAIVTYDLKVAREAFERAGYRGWALTDIWALLDTAEKEDKLTSVQRMLVEDWQKDTVNWAKRRGLS